jgi:hypothetical protein
MVSIAVEFPAETGMFRGIVGQYSAKSDGKPPIFMEVGGECVFLNNERKN